MKKLKKPVNPLNFRRKEELSGVYGYMLWAGDDGGICVASQYSCLGANQVPTAPPPGGGGGCDVLGSGKPVCNGNSWTPPPTPPTPCQQGAFLTPPPPPPSPCVNSFTLAVIGDPTCGHDAVGCFGWENENADDGGW